jgi:hypothetical protein
MDSVRRTQLLAKPEVKATVTEIAQKLREALPGERFAENEEFLLAVTGEASRVVLEQELQHIADSLPERLLVDRVEHKQHEPGTVVVCSLSGSLELRRYTFRQVGVHNGPTVDPTALVAGLVEGATPAMAYSVAHGYAQHDMRSHAESLEAAARVAPPRATLERLAKRLAQQADAAVPKLEPLLRRAETVPSQAQAISIGLDRTSVLMSEERPADAPPKEHRPRRKPRVRRPAPDRDVNWRMAYVGTVSIVDADGEALTTRRYAAPASDDPSELVARMCADVEAAMKQAPQLEVGIVQDGAQEMWNATREGLTALQQREVIAQWHEGIDRFHLLERLAEALALVEPDATERHRLLGDWRQRLDTQDSAIDSIEHFLIRHYNETDTKTQQQLWEHVRYVQNNKDRMRYVTHECAGLPVGSGVTESAAKTVVGRRAKNAGQRWSEPGLRGVLTLRALHQSQRLPRFWSRFSHRYVKNVESA